MTSKQVHATNPSPEPMLTGIAPCRLVGMVMLTALLSLLGACATQHTSTLPDPYGERRVFAVAPIANESGSLEADGLRLADQLASQLENAGQIDVVPVNRVIAAMEAMGITQLTNPGDALKVVAMLGVDGLVVGTISAYDPYTPPKLGMALELYANPRREAPAEAVDVRKLTQAATQDQAFMHVKPVRQPVSVVSAFFDGADPQVRHSLQKYVRGRGQDARDDIWSKIPTYESPAEQNAWRRYLLSMDLYSEFVSYEMSWRLMSAELRRLQPQQANAEPSP